MISGLPKYACVILFWLANFGWTVTWPASAQTGAPEIPGDAAADRVIVLTGATIHPVSSPVIENGIVILRNDKIDFLGAADAQSKDANAADRELIDCTGKHIYPSLIDADTAIGLVEIEAVRATVDTNETGNFNPNAKAVVAFNPDSELIPVARADGILIAHSVPRGGVISGQSAVMYLDGWNESDMAILRTAGIHVNWPAAGAFRAWWSNQSAKKQMQQRAQRLKQLSDEFSTAHRYDEARNADANYPYDARLDALTAVTSGARPVFVHADELRQIQEAVSFANREKLRLVIVGGADAAECADLLKKHDVPVIVTGTLRLPQARHTAYDDPYSLPSRLQLAGVRFCLAGFDRFQRFGCAKFVSTCGNCGSTWFGP